MSRNNFKKLEEQQAKKIGFPPKRIKNEVESSQSFFQYISNLIELFLPKLLQTLLGLPGDKSDENKSLKDRLKTKTVKNKKYPNTHK